MQPRYGIQVNTTTRRIKMVHKKYVNNTVLYFLIIETLTLLLSGSILYVKYTLPLQTVKTYQWYTDPVLISLPIFIPKQYRESIYKACTEVKIPQDILARIIEAESSWDYTKKSLPNKNGTIDHGLCQLNSKSLEDFQYRYNKGETIDPYNPELSIRIAARYLASLQKITNDWRKTVAAYNCGLSKVKANAIPVNTQKYVEKIMGGTNVFY